MLTKLLSYPASCFISLIIFANNIYAIDTKDSNNQDQLHDSFFKTPSPLIPDINHRLPTCLASQLQIKDKYLNEWFPSFGNSLTTEIKENISNRVDDILKDVPMGGFDSSKEIEYFLGLEITKLMKNENNYPWIKGYFFKRLYDLSMNAFNNLCKNRCLGSFQYNLILCERILYRASSYFSALSHELAEKTINSFASSQSKRILKGILHLE